MITELSFLREFPFSFSLLKLPDFSFSHYILHTTLNLLYSLKRATELYKQHYKPEINRPNM